jgi:hypothetical protein
MKAHGHLLRKALLDLPATDVGEFTHSFSVKSSGEVKITVYNRVRGPTDLMSQRKPSTGDT